MVVTVAVSDKNPLKRGASFECPPNPPRYREMAHDKCDISWGDIGIGHPCKKELSCPLGSTSGGASGSVVGRGIS